MFRLLVHPRTYNMKFVRAFISLSSLHHKDVLLLAAKLIASPRKKKREQKGAIIKTLKEPPLTSPTL